MEVVSLMVSESAATKFSVTISSQQGLFAQMKPSVKWGSSFVDNFRVGSDSIFGDDFQVKSNCVHGRILVTVGEAV